MTMILHSDVQFETAIPYVSSTITFHKTFMDTIGRTTLTITAINVVDDLRDRDLIVRYTYPFAARLRKPLIFVAGLAALLVVSWIVGNLDVSIGRKQKDLLKKNA
jgi:oligosaccharyltransferase complex subunit alpha (ribophorin I)